MSLASEVISPIVVVPSLAQPGNLTLTGSCIVQLPACASAALVVNVIGTPTGSGETLTVSAAEVDPVDRKTAITAGATCTTASLNSVGAVQATLGPVRSGCIKVTWTIAGTTPVFPSVNISLVPNAADVASGGATGIPGPAAAAPADAEANTGAISLMSRIGARLAGYNGTTWDMLRAGVTALGTSVTGMLNTLPQGIYNATPTAPTEGQRGGFQITIGRALSTQELQAPNYENQSVGRAMVEESYLTQRITTATSTLDMISGPGFLHKITWGKLTASEVISVYDALTVTGTPIYVYTAPATLLSQAPQVWMANRKMVTGLTIVTATGTDDITVHYRGLVGPQ